MKPVRYVTSSLAVFYDAAHDRLVKVRSLIDDRGREWERYGEGLPVLLASPNEPAKVNRKARGNSEK